VARYGWLAIFQDDPDRARERFEDPWCSVRLDPLEFNLRMGIAFRGPDGEYAQAAKLIRTCLTGIPKSSGHIDSSHSVSALDEICRRHARRLKLDCHPNASIEFMSGATHRVIHRGSSI
jgi:hypothetical protein